MLKSRLAATDELYALYDGVKRRIDGGKMKW